MTVHWIATQPQRLSSWDGAPRSYARLRGLGCRVDTSSQPGGLGALNTACSLAIGRRSTKQTVTRTPAWLQDLAAFLRSLATVAGSHLVAPAWRLRDTSNSILSRGSTRHHNTCQTPTPRCHLMIGAAASGKSTAARILACALQTPEQPPVRYISSTDIRQHLYGAAGGLGHWRDIKAEMQQQLWDAINAGETAIVEATYCKRAFRLAITQAMALPQPVQWIGWWLDTPEHLCLQRNQQRAQPVPNGVIRRQCAQLLQSAPVPHRKEGFSQVVRLQPSDELPLSALIHTALAGMEATIQRGANRDAAHELHHYSRLLDQERLLYLVHLLCQHPQLTVTDGPDDPDLECLLSPLPSGDLPQRAAAILARLHGACFGDAEAIARDLEWLDRQGFTAWGDPASREAAAERPLITPPPWPACRPRPSGGLSRLADREAFSLTFTVLRHLLHHPYERGLETPIDEHIAAALTRECGGRRHWQARQVHTAISETLTPYGFRRPGSSGRRGFALGTALLSMEQLQEACLLLELQSEDLGDRSARALSCSLRERLQQIGVDPDGHPPRRRWLQPHRLMHDALQPGRRDERLAEGVIEAAIRLRQKLQIAQPIGPGQPSAALSIWPLQWLLHHGRWWLLHEHVSCGLQQGLLACIPVDQVHVFQDGHRSSRAIEVHRQALQRATALLQLCGGLCFGSDLNHQQQLLQAGPEERRSLLRVLRLRCTPEAMTTVRRDLERFAASAIRLSQPLPGDSWGPTLQRRYALQADEDPSHPYPVEIDLPPWVLAGDRELRRWLLSHGPAIRLEAPSALVNEHRLALTQALQAYAESSTGALSG